jgi:hypothetical protein
MADGTHIADYPHQTAGHCGSGALRDLMQWANLSYDSAPLSEGTVFGLGGQLGFSYFRQPQGTPAIYLVGRGPDLTGDFCRRLAITAQVRSTDDPLKGWSWIRDELDDGHPVLCWADIGELPYLRVRMQMSRHDIVIIGYDDVAGMATVIDNDRADPQSVSYQALARARSSTSFPAPTRHTTYRLRFPTQLPPLADVAADACRASADALRRPPPTTSGHGALVSGSGLDGMHVFADDIAHWPDNLTPQQLDDTLRTLAAFVEKAGTGGGLFRRLQADFLDHLARSTGDPDAEQAAATYAQLADTWTALAHVAASNADLSTRTAASIDIASQLPARETQGVRELQILARL